MILDSLRLWRQYVPLSPHFSVAFSFLESLPEQPAVGRCEIEGEDVFAFVQRHMTAPVETRQYEAHRRYIDIQYIVQGREIMHWAPLPMLTHVTMPFDVEKDAALFGLTPGGTPISVQAGHFAIFFPEDGHVPSCAWDEPAEVLKVVVKVRVT
jgi:YhcH/YjgK/YiaL family protein